MFIPQKSYRLDIRNNLRDLNFFSFENQFIPSFSYVPTRNNNDTLYSFFVRRWASATIEDVYQVSRIKGKDGRYTTPASDHLP